MYVCMYVCNNKRVVVYKFCYSCEQKYSDDIILITYYQDNHKYALKFVFEPIKKGIKMNKCFKKLINFWINCTLKGVP